MCMVSLYMLAILCCHTIDWDIFLRYWCLSQIYYYYYYIIICTYLKTYLLRLWRKQISVNPPVKFWCWLKRLLKSSICPWLQFHNSYKLCFSYEDDFCEKYL